ncbi:MAG: hypothetical protein PHN18_12610 [Sulfurospirillaceae bacterium]|nr:hypothetical protein [Sulfurospirillaceae bacterium]MDD2827705.1 hypothetical protein [Sulfurospirillaceae bacterium]
MKPFDKYIILQRLHIEESLGAIFSTENARKFYGVDFQRLTYKKHYEPCLSCVIDATGAHGDVALHFTEKGIKKLLKTNEKMQKEINDLWEENKVEWNLAQYEKVQ